MIDSKKNKQNSVTSSRALLIIALIILPILLTNSCRLLQKPSPPIVLSDSKEVFFLSKGAVDANTPPWDAVCISKGRYLELIDYEMTCIENGL